MCKIKNFFGLISVYLLFNIKNGVVRIAACPKKLKWFKLPVIYVLCHERSKSIFLP